MGLLDFLSSKLTGTPMHPQWLLERRWVPQNLGGTVLDIGSADQWIRGHVPSDATYIALDYPPTGRGLYGSRPHVFGDAASLPIRDGVIDVVVCFEVLEHLRDHASALQEMTRVLKPGGKVLATIPFLYPVHDAPFDFQRLTEHGLVRDFKRAGLEVKRLSKTGHAIAASALLLSLAIAGGAYHLAGWRRAAIMPFAVAGVLVVNVAGWLGSLLWPDWGAIGSGYVAELEKSVA